VYSTLLLSTAIAVFVAGYLAYGKYLAKVFRLDSSRPTPAHSMTDGVDYVPAKAPVLLGHHFASIAGAGPIVGPIIASVFGWLPAFVWILLGAVLIGGVHDFSTLVASIRHRGRSIGDILEVEVGPAGKILFGLFAWSTLVLVVAVFIRIVAVTLVAYPQAATSSVLFIGLAVVFGLGLYRLRLPLLPASVVGVFLLALCVALGQAYPLRISFDAWVYILVGYVFVASVTPVWILLQPRDYLNSFLLYGLLTGAVIGVFFARPELNLSAYTGFSNSLGYLFPVLFVTVACGAISGFHSMVSSGTTAKQLNRETDARAVGYGSMLIEGILAVVALLAAATLIGSRFQVLYDEHKFVPIFSEGVGGFLSRIPFLGIPREGASSFAALAVSAFALTSLDTCTRLARFVLQEFFERRGTRKQPILARNRYLSTAICVAAGLAFLKSGRAGEIWPVFGSANQMLGALALLAVTVWLARAGRRNSVVKFPMYFMFAVTLSALGTLIYRNFVSRNVLLLVVSAVLFVVAVALGFLGRRSLSQAAAVAAEGSGADR